MGKNKILALICTELEIIQAFLCIDCRIYCGPRRYNRNLHRCSKCASKFKRQNKFIVLKGGNVKNE